MDGTSHEGFGMEKNEKLEVVRWHRTYNDFLWSHSTGARGELSSIEAEIRVNHQHY